MGVKGLSREAFVFGVDGAVQAEATSGIRRPMAGNVAATHLPEDSSLSKAVERVGTLCRGRAAGVVVMLDDRKVKRRLFLPRQICGWGLLVIVRGGPRWPLSDSGSQPQVPDRQIASAFRRCSPKSWSVVRHGPSRKPTHWQATASTGQPSAPQRPASWCLGQLEGWFVSDVSGARLSLSQSGPHFNASGPARRGDEKVRRSWGKK